jgi:hypothetical protein
MENGVVEVLLQSGVLGIVALIALLVARKLYLDLAKSRKAKDELHEKHKAEINAIHERHKEEMKALEERYITKAETWMGQYHDLAKAGFEIADAQERRYGR